MISGYWTGIGSRETPEDVMALMVAVGKLMTDQGWVLRSGGADGADSAFYAGSLQSDNFQNAKPYIYISWDGMSNSTTVYQHDPSRGIYNAKLYDTWDEANAIALSLRGSFERLGWRGIAHHTRNVFQVLGHDLSTPSKFLMCWAIPVGKRGDRSKVKGGTTPAVRLAIQRNIEVINLYKNDEYNRAIRFLDKHSVVHQFQFKPEEQ